MTTLISTSPIGPTNVELADVLGQMADLLVRCGEPNPYRVQAYLQAAVMIRRHETPLAEIYGVRGRDGLVELPGIGVNLASHLIEYIENGRIGLRDRLMQAEDPAALLATVPGIGESLASRLVASGIRSLTTLERAAHDGLLAEIAGFGPRRLEALRLQLNSILHRSARRRERRVRRQVARLASTRATANAETVTSPPEEPGTLPEAQPLATIYPLFPPAAA